MTPTPIHISLAFASSALSTESWSSGPMRRVMSSVTTTQYAQQTYRGRRHFSSAQMQHDDRHALAGHRTGLGAIGGPGLRSAARPTEFRGWPGYRVDMSQRTDVHASAHPNPVEIAVAT